MFEELNQHRAAVAEQIQKACEIGFTGGELEKAHKVGDIHPNGKWVWTQLPSGRYDWRVIKKTSAPSGGAAPATAQKRGISISANHPSLASVPGVQNIKDALTTYNSKYTDLSKVELIKTPKGNWDLHYDGHRLGIIAGGSISDRNAAKMGWIRNGSDDLTRSKQDEKDYDVAEYKRQRGLAEKSDDDALNFGLGLVKTNLHNKEKELEQTKKDRPGAKATIAKLENEVKYFKAQEKAFEEIIKEKEAKKTKKTTGDKEFDPKNPYQVHAVNYLLGTPGGWTMKTAGKYVANLSEKELMRLAHYDM